MVTSEWHEKLLIDDAFEVAGHRLTSRLVVGTGKYSNFEIMRLALLASGAQMVTVALRRVNLSQPQDSLLSHLPSHMKLLPNTAGCYTADEAIRMAHLAREAGLSNWVKLEVIGDEKTLMPDNEQTLVAAKELVRDGFCVFPYIADDVVLAKKLESIGCCAVMPLASPIGSGLGLLNPHQIKLMIEAVKIPVIVDAGVGTASDAAQVMELGCSAILMNTALAQAQNPVQMAMAMKLAVQAGRLAYQSGRMPKRAYASASSPLKDIIE